MKLLAVDQLAISEATAVFGADFAALHRQLFRGNIQPTGRQADEDLPDLRCGVHDGGPAVLHRVACCGVACVRSALRVGRDEIDPIEINREFLGRDLNQRGFYALPQFRLAGEHGAASIGVDANPGVEHRLICEASRKRSFRWLGIRSSVIALSAKLLRQKRETYDQRTPAREKMASGEECSGDGINHRLAPFALPLDVFCRALAGRTTARRLRMCVPHRHRFGLRGSRMSASEADGFFSSSAWARMIMPGMQYPHCAACSSMKACCSGPGSAIVPD